MPPDEVIEGVKPADQQPSAPEPDAPIDSTNAVTNGTVGEVAEEGEPGKPRSGVEADPVKTASLPVGWIVLGLGLLIALYFASRPGNGPTSAGPSPSPPAPPQPPL